MEESEAKLRDIAARGALRVTRSMPRAGVSLLDALADEFDANSELIAVVRSCGDRVEATVNRCEVQIRGELRDRAGQLTFARAVRTLLISDAGKAALADEYDNFDAYAKAQQARLDAARREVDERERRQREARLADEVAATPVEKVLSDLAATGVTVRATANGGITISPPGLSALHRAVLDSKRDHALRVLKARDAVESL